MRCTYQEKTQPTLMHVKLHPLHTGVNVKSLSNVIGMLKTDEVRHHLFIAVICSPDIQDCQRSLINQGDGMPVDIHVYGLEVVQAAITSLHVNIVTLLGRIAW